MAPDHGLNWTHELKRSASIMPQADIGWAKNSVNRLLIPQLMQLTHMFCLCYWAEAHHRQSWDYGKTNAISYPIVGVSLPWVDFSVNFCVSSNSVPVQGFLGVIGCCCGWKCGIGRGDRMVRLAAVCVWRLLMGGYILWAWIPRGVHVDGNWRHE